MNNYLRTCLLCMLLTPAIAVYANNFSLPWLEPVLMSEPEKWPIASLREMQGVYDCGEVLQKEYCSETVKYYKTNVESTILIADDQVKKIQVTAQFSVINYAELQLNLRKDGFALAWIEIGDKQFDVIAALKEQPFYKVDREVVMLMNKGAITTPRKLIWYPKAEYYDTEHSRYAEFLSDGHTVTINFVMGERVSTTLQ